ncbi:MAG TPA: class I SAM-dependent methyltransferase [Nevskiaceae bacterium]|nr:class I SAM-dependent methyltransferase [Nevskiaceae bacterium]
MDSLKQDARLQAMLAKLHARSRAQEATLARHTTEMGFRSVAGSAADVAADRAFYADKLVALDADKAEFCYRLCRAMGARTLVEAGTSYGVSTLYLAAAVRDNGGGSVIATEYEAPKAAMAREHFAQAGLADCIDLREGDLRQTLQSLPPVVDFLLLDIWIAMVPATLELVGPHLRAGAVVVADNTASNRARYASLFDYFAAHGFSTQTLPFAGGFEMAVKTG